MNTIARNQSGFFHKTALTVTLLCTTSMTAYAAPEIQPFEEVRVSENMIVAGDSTGGGAWVSENENIWKQGVITGIQVCSGDYVNRIQVFYANRPGTEFGGPGGNCAPVWSPPTGEYIQGVRVWSGAWMNKIQFVTNKQKESPAYGGGGGNEKTHYSDTGGALRVIDGKYGSFMNGIRLGFGYPYYVDGFAYTGEPDPTPLPVQQLIMQTVDNCGSGQGNANTTAATSETVTDTHTLSIGGSATIGLSTTLQAGIPDVASVGVTTSSSLTFNISKDETKTTEVKLSIDAPAAAAPGTYAKIDRKVKRDKVNVPFKYDVVHYSGNRSNEVDRKTYSGTYTGVRAISIDTTRTEFDCQTKQPLSQAALDAIRNPAPPVRQPDLPVRQPAPINPQPAYVPPTPQTEYIELSTSASLTETLSFVMTSNDGMFDQIEPDVWEEVSGDGGVFTYDVFDRDEDCIYLLDRDRGVVIVIDVTRNKIGYAPNADSEPFDLYEIIERG